MFKYILILLIFKNYLLVTAYNAPPDFNLEFLSNDKCKTTGLPIIFYNEPFNVILKDDSEPEISNITCFYQYHSDYTYAVAESIQKREDNMFNITFRQVEKNVNNAWKCEMTFNTKQKKQCSLEVYIRKSGSVIINDKVKTLPIIRNPESKWDASDVYHYTEGEILNIRKVNKIYNTHIYIMKDEKKIFETHEFGEVQLLLNTKYYNGIMFMYMDLCTYRKDSCEKLELKMIPITDNPIETKLLFDGLPLTPENIEKISNEIHFYYNYIFTFRRLLTIECRVVNPDNSNQVWFDNPSHHGIVKGGNSETEIIQLEEIEPTKDQKCSVFNVNGIIIENHIIRFKYQSPMDYYISGLSVNRTYYQLKREALYAYYDGENLTLEYSQPNNYNLMSTNSRIEWVFQGEKKTGKTLNITLTEKHNGTNITCTRSNLDRPPILHTVHLLLKKKDETNRDQSAVAVSTNFLKSNKYFDKKIDIKNKQTTIGKEGVPFNIYIIAASGIVVVVVLFATLCFVRSSYRKRKVKEATDVSYDNLSNNTQPPFPPNWDSIARSQVKVDELYSVPYTRQTEDITYEEPTCTRVGADIYTEPKRKLKSAADVYANVSAAKDTTPSVVNVQDTYAQVIPKALRKVENPYVDMENNPDSYENVFKGDPYINYNNSDYVEAAYCALSDLK